MNDQTSALARPTSLIVSATFTADPILQSMQYWIDQLKLPAAVQIAPYNQVFQQLLDSSSLLSSNDDGINVLLIRLQDWSADTNAGVDLSQLKSRADELVDTVIHFLSGDSSAELIILFCEASPNLSSEDAAFIQRLEDGAASTLNQHNGVQAISSQTQMELYPVEDYADPQGDRLANIPYTGVYFAGLGTRVIRNVYSAICPPKKVIVVDCDDTLWSGLCGEVGPAGVRIESHQARLQSLLREQQRLGMLICLASRNNEADVLSVFRDNPSMILTLDDITHSEIHWQAKSISVQSLSEKMQLATNTFIFIDDDPVQCSEVNHSLPDVMTVIAPKSTWEMEQMERHMWPLDSGKVTQESSTRTQSYRDHARRETIRAASPTLQSFLESLELKVIISSMTSNDIPRAHELTQRTTQFNLTGLKLTSAELMAMMNEAGVHCDVVRASDRFGDYGLVGLMIYEVSAAALQASVFLLSCRALGRSVEHQMYGHLAHTAGEAGSATVVLTANQTERNAPALNFLNSLGDVLEENNGALTLRLSATSALSINPADTAATTALDSTMVRPDTANLRPTQSDAGFQIRTQCLSEMFRSLGQPSEILAAVSNAHSPDGGTQSIGSDYSVQRFLTSLFCELLGVQTFDGDVSFFELGGHSLQAVQVLARASSEYDIEMDPTLLFTTNFTVEELSEEIDHLVASRGSIQGVSGLLEQISNLTD